MRGTLAGNAFIWLLASALLTGADFWQEKPFTSWSAQQVEKMLTDSPWARNVTVVVGRLREGALGGFESGGAGPGGGGGASRTSENDDPGFQQIRRVNVTVIWISALPVRQALLRRQAGLGAQITPEQQQRLLGEDEPFYTLVVLGLPMRLAARLGTIEEVTATTSLKPNGKARIAPEDVRVSRDGEQFFRVELLFPKTSAIALGDKDVAFTTKLGDVEVAKKFKLADMTVGGRLAL